MNVRNTMDVVSIKPKKRAAKYVLLNE